MTSFVYKDKINLITYLKQKYETKNSFNIKILIPINKLDKKEEITKTLTSFFTRVNIDIDEIAESNNDIFLIFNSSEVIENSLKIELSKIRKMALLGDMLANISHQWRQPLTIITSSASAILLHKELNILDDNTIDKFSNNIISQGQFLAETIDVFRKYIKKDNEIKTIILQEEIENILKLVNAVLKENKIKVINNIESKEKVSLNLIVGELSQVIINIINNAKDIFIQKEFKNPEIIFDLNILKNKVQISIEDNAGGISEKIIDKVFDADFSTKEKTGTGIGLFMSYEIMTEHLNGNLYVKNTNNGAKFFIELPL